MDTERQIRRLVEYFRAGERQVEDCAIGMEFEHLILQDDTLRAVTYFGDRGIQALLERLTGIGWQPSYENDYILGLHKQEASISVEPGGQLEFNVAPKKNLRDSEKVYQGVLSEIIPILDEWGLTMVTVGYQPVTPIEDIPLLPKQRYQWMYSYFAAKGKYAHNMMKGTASTQVCIDYSDEHDYVRKSRVVSFLSPFVYAVFDNAPFFIEGAGVPHAVRCAIWNNCDPDRCGFPTGVFDDGYSYAAYADYILNLPSLIVLKDGQLAYTRGEKPVKEYFDPDTFTDEEIDYLLSMCFPDIRTRRYLEIRMGDSVPYPLNFAYAAFWKGLLYNPDNLQSLYDEASKYSQEQIEALKCEITERGTAAIFDGVTVLDRFRHYLFCAREGLPAEEVSYLLPLERMITQGLRPKDITRARLHLGKRQALDWCVLGRQRCAVQSCAER